MMHTAPPTPRCIACGYEMGPPDASSVCPECGRALDSPHRAAARARAALEERLPRLLLRNLVAWGVVIAVYAAGAAVVTGSPVEGALTLAMLGVGVAGTIAMGWWSARLAHPWERAMFRAAWLRALPWLHGPWLMIAPATAIILLVALIDRWSYADGMLTGTMSLVGFLLWLIGVVGCLSGAIVAWGAQVRRVSLPDFGGPSPTAMGAVIALFPVVLGGCSVVGLMGGATAALAAIELVMTNWGGG